MCSDFLFVLPAAESGLVDVGNQGAYSEMLAGLLPAPPVSDLCIILQGLDLFSSVS